MFRTLLLLAALSTSNLAAPLSTTPDVLIVRDDTALAALKAVSYALSQDQKEDLESGATPFIKRQDREDDLEMGGTPFSKRQDDDDDLEMGATPFSRRHDPNEDLELGGTPFSKRSIYDKVDIDGFRRSQATRIQVANEAARFRI
jgi:hypothetical protein